MAGATVDADLTYNPLNASGDKAYPITSPTYIIVYKTTKNAAQTTNIQGWLNYVLGPAQGTGQGCRATRRCRAASRSKAVAQIDQIK